MKKKRFAHLCTEVLHVLVLILLFGMTSCIQEDNIVPEVSVPDGYVNYFVEDLSFSCSAGEQPIYGRLRFTTESPSKITLDNQGSFGSSKRCQPGDSVTAFMQVSYTGAYITEADYHWRLYVGDSVVSKVVNVIAPHKQDAPPMWRFKAPDVAGDYTVTFKAKYEYSSQTEVGQIYGESSRSTGILEVR